MDQELSQQLEALTNQVSDLASEVKSLDGRFVTRTDLVEYLTVRAFDDRMERLTVDVLSKVTKSMQAMFNDAVKEATTVAIESYTDTEAGKQWFRDALAEDRALARKERYEDFRKVLTSGRAVVLWIIPLVTLISTLGQIFGWW